MECNTALSSSGDLPASWRLGTELEIVNDEQTITVGCAVLLADVPVSVLLQEQPFSTSTQEWKIYQRCGANTIFAGTLSSTLPIHETHNITQLASQTPLKKNVPVVGENVKRDFGELAAQWKHGRDKYDSGTKMFVHPAYQAIIGMGERVLPLIFEELHRELDHWFWALRAITRADPIPAKDVGDLEAMRRYWLAWASRNGYQWQINSTSIPNDQRNSLR
jgi:hypothetical protein